MASAPLAVPLVGVREATALGGGIEVELSALNNPDEIRATISSGRVDVATMPLQTAALLANGGLEISLLVVINANLLKVLSPGTDAWQGLHGQTIHCPSAATRPTCCSACWPPTTDWSPIRTSPWSMRRHCQTWSPPWPRGRGDHAVLPEHMATVARQQRPDLQEVLDLADQWRASTPSAGLPASCLVVRRQYAKDHPDVVAALEQHCLAAADRVAADPSPLADELSELSGAPVEIVADVVARLGVSVATVDAARADVTTLLETLTEAEPRSTGGGVPGDAFFGA